MYDSGHFSSSPAEDMQDLRRQMKVMEDKNMTYVQQCLDLEEVRK